MSLDKITLTLHEAKEIIGLLGTIKTGLIVNFEQEKLLVQIDKIRNILLNAKEEYMGDSAERNKMIWAALIRGLRAGVAFGLPYLISWLAQNPNPKLIVLGPLIMAVGKYLRSVYKWDWLPV